MDNSWVKLYRKIGDNEIMFDATALQIFMYLLIHVDKKTGELRTGRFIIAQTLKINPNTVYSVLKRLEKKYKIINNHSNNKYTTISLLNWSKYNEYKDTSTQSINNKITTNQQQNNTIQDIKTKDIKTITNVIKEFGNPDINEISKYFLEIMKLPKEDCSIKQSRQYWNLLLKEMGIEKLKGLIDLAKQDEFMAPNITSSKDLYYKRIKIISRKRGTGRPIIAVMPQGGDINE